MPFPDGSFGPAAGAICVPSTDVFVGMNGLELFDLKGLNERGDLRRSVGECAGIGCSLPGEPIMVFARSCGARSGRRQT